MTHKVYASGPKQSTVTVTGPPVGDCSTVYIPKKAARYPKRAFSKSWQQIYRRTFAPVEKVYKRLSWTTRQTIRVGISLYAVLYVFLSVPFRIAFYYDPYGKHEVAHVHRWTAELSVFAVLDALADLIGIIEFLRFYRVQRGLLSRFMSFDPRRTLSRVETPFQANKMLTRGPSFNGLQRGKTKWTLASIGKAATEPGNSADDSISQRIVVRDRTFKFVLEIIALIPVEIIPYASGTFNALHLVRITKLCRLYRLRYCVERFANIYSDRTWVQHISSTGIDSLVRNIGVCAGLCHWVACGYMMIAHAQCGVSLEACDERIETSWVVRDRLFGATVTRKYCRTLYWASRMLVLLGYDDVTPVSDAETVYAVFVNVLGALFGSSLLATFLFIFRFRNARYAAFATHVDNAREYMKSQNIPRALRRQVIAYFNYSWNTHHSLDSEEALHLMPKHLQSKVVSTLKASRIKQVCFLVKESVEFINLLAAALVRRVYSPMDQIIEPKFNAQMFFVVRGRVALSAFNGSNPKECQTGDFFADTCLLFPEKFEEKAIAKTFCELYVLAKAKFDETLADFYRETAPEVRDRMAETHEKHTIQLRKTKKLLGMRARGASGNGASFGGSSHSITADSDATSTHLNHKVGWRFPGSSFRVHWDAARLFATLYVAFEVPYYSVFVAMTEDQRMFGEQPAMGLRYTTTLLIEVFFGVHLILRSRFLVHLDPIVMLAVDDPELIFAAYKANGFFPDLIAWLPVGVILESLATAYGQQYSSFARLLRLLRLREVPELLWNVCDYYSVSSKAHLVISLILGVTFMLHVVGCVWFEMAWIPHGETLDAATESTMLTMTRGECLHQATLFGNCSWVTFDCYANIGEAFPAEDPESSYQASFAYMRSVYWAIVTLTAVGYGDIVAYSTAESIFAALWIFVGGIINFGVVGAMSSTISNAMAPHHHHIEKLNALNSILERMDISEKLSTEIRRFYHHEFTERKKAYESQLLSHLPDHLCYEISSLLHSEAVKSVTLFDSASIEFLKEVTGKFRHRTYQNGDIICLEGNVCREFFVLLHGSKVNVFFRSRKVPIRALHEGDCYGANCFLLRRPHSVTLAAASLVHASVMTREQFDVIRRKFEDDLRDMREEAQTLWLEQQKNMKRIVHNLEKLKLQPHMVSTATLFYIGDTSGNSISAGKEVKVERDVYAARNRLQSLWHAVITCWNVYNAAFVIVRICFHSHLHYSNTSIWIADLCCDACFAVDIYLRLFYFGCPEAGVENLVNRLKMDRQFLRSSAFKWNLVASLPIYIPYSSGSMAASLARLPRLIRCLDLVAYLDDVIVQIQQHFASHNVYAYLSPAKLMIILVLVAHYVGCIFFLISEHECHHVERCWMEHDHMLHQYHHSVPMLYAKTFYWAITTLLLVGSREIVPRDTAGTLWTGFTCLCCTFIIGHIVGEISELILELGKETKQYKARIASFDSFAKEHKLPEGLRKRVVFFFRLQFEHTKGLDMHHTTHDLSANLQLKFMLEIYGHSIALMPISRFLTASQVNNLALRLKSELFIPGDNILVEGTFGSRLCILRKGLGAVFWSSSVTSVAVLMEGALFGEVAFFLSSQRRLATVRATTSCEVLYVIKHDWQELWTTTEDLSDTQVQKHALHAILDWVHVRLYRYQRSCLRTANKVKRLLAARHHTPTSLHATAAAATGTIRAKTRLSAVLLNHHEHSDHHLSSFHAPSRPVPTKRLSMSSEMHLLELKTRYIQAKTEKCAKKFRPAIEAMQAHRRTSSVISGRSLRSSISKTSTASGMYRSTIGDPVAPFSHSHSASGLDIRMLQFMVDASPVNKLVRECLSDDHIRAVENECWARFKLLSASQYIVNRLLEELVPKESTFMHMGVSGSAEQRTQIKVNPTRGKLVRTRSFRYDEVAHRKQRVHSLALEAAPSALLSGPNTAKKWKAAAMAASPNLGSILSEGNGGMHNRRFSVATAIAPSQQVRGKRVAPLKSEPAARLGRMLRCHSLPQFDREFFDKINREEDGLLSVGTPQSGIDFDILQRCQRPEYSTHLMLFHQYRTWKDQRRSVVVPDQQKMTISRRHVNDARSPSTRETSRDARSPAAGSRLQLSGQQALQAASIELQAKEFIKVVKQMGKAWDVVMLLVAVYHLVVTPFKVCFSHDFSQLSGGVLRGWSGFEIFLDLLCVFDVAYKLRNNSTAHEGGTTTSASTLRRGLRDVLSNPAIRTDIFAMFPLEILLLAGNVRVPLPYASIHGETEISWWTTRWLLRMNRMLLVGRIEPLSEQLFQFIIYDRKIPVNEAFLYFVRGLSSWLTMGHLLACIWFVTSDLGFYHYGTSWLSTSGMLTFIGEITEVEEHERRLSEVLSGFSLDGISLSRKYLRSLLFSLECISTLFSGDILSMNPAELLAEIVITLWSIYIYGALVGAQGELLDAHAKREAAFEQTLGELQHYLVQNEVPKGIKRQVKAYYARLWRRRKGEAEFAAVEKVSRALYEDVVLSTVRSFAVQVEDFRALDEQFLRALLVCLEYVVCSENEEVFVMGDMDRNMYFIAQGRVSVRMGSSESTRERGEFFGELALLYGIPRLETCVALSVTELYRLDHEPYEKLLREFPEYRARNKLAWTTQSSGSVQDRSIVEEALRCFRQFSPFSVAVNGNTQGPPSLNISTLVSMEDIAANSERVDAQLPHSYIYRSAMELLSKLSKVDPLEAKDLFLKSRDGARKQLKAALGVVTARHEDPDEVRSFNSRCPSPRNDKDTERHSDSLEQLEAAVAELSTPSSLTKSPSLRLIERRPSIPVAFETLDEPLQVPELRRGSTITDILSQAENG